MEYNRDPDTLGNPSELEYETTISASLYYLRSNKYSLLNCDEYTCEHLTRA